MFLCKVVEDFADSSEHEWDIRGHFYCILQKEKRVHLRPLQNFCTLPLDISNPSRLLRYLA
jgi:hypothetical protein